MEETIEWKLTCDWKLKDRDERKNFHLKKRNRGIVNIWFSTIKNRLIKTFCRVWTPKLEFLPNPKNNESFDGLLFTDRRNCLFLVIRQNTMFQRLTGLDEKHFLQKDILKIFVFMWQRFSTSNNVDAVDNGLLSEYYLQWTIIPTCLGLKLRIHNGYIIIT